MLEKNIVAYYGQGPRQRGKTILITEWNRIDIAKVKLLEFGCNASIGTLRLIQCRVY